MKSPQPMQNNLHREYLSIKRGRSNEIFFSQRLSYKVFLTTTFSQLLSHNVFLTTSFTQRLFFTLLPLHILPHNVVLTTSQYMRNLSVLYKCPKISQIRLSSVPCNLNILGSIKLRPRRCTSAIYILSVCDVSEP